MDIFEDIITKTIDIAVQDKLLMNLGMRSGGILRVRGIGVKAGVLMSYRDDLEGRDPREDMKNVFRPRVMVRIEAIDFVEVLEKPRSAASSANPPVKT